MEHLFLFEDGDVWGERKLNHTLLARSADGKRTLAALTPAIDVNGDTLRGVSECRLYSQAEAGPKAA